MNFTHLHVHSDYSLLDGLTKVDDLVQNAKNQGMTSLALTDHGAMYGAFKFYLSCREAGINPIIGVEAYKAKQSRLTKQTSVNRDQFHLVLLAKNYEGYRNLMKLTTEAHLTGFYYKPRIDFELLEKYHQGLIVLSGCLNSEICTAIAQDQYEQAEKILKRYLTIFEGNYYLELQRHQNVELLKKVNEHLIKLSKKFAVPLVATNDIHYLTADDAYAQEILLCIQTQHTVVEKNRPLSMINVPEYYFKTASEMSGLFIDLTEAIENTEKIASECNVEIPYGKWILPHYQLEEGDNPQSALRRAVAENVNKRVKLSEDVQKRIDYELEVIGKRGYSTYFLIVSDFVSWAKSQGIAVGPGRGSVAGSLVAYITSITDINPLEYNLPFERFLNPDRPTPPDIDVDFADIRRDEVLEYVTKKYGEEKVAQIITFGRMEARLAVRDVARALGMSFSECDRIAKLIPHAKLGFPLTIEKALEENPALTYAYQNEEDTRRVLDIGR